MGGREELDRLHKNAEQPAGAPYSTNYHMEYRSVGFGILVPSILTSRCYLTRMSVISRNELAKTSPLIVGEVDKPLSILHQMAV